MERPALPFHPSKIVLVDAAARGDLETVRLCVQHGMNVNVCHDKRTPLIAASGENQAEVVEFLLAQRADPNKSDSFNSVTPLMAAANGHSKVVRLLLVHGADPNRTDLHNTISPLMVAASCHTCDPDCLKHLLAAKADVNHIGQTGNTVLFPFRNHSENDEMDLARVLFAHGAHITQREFEVKPGVYTGATMKEWLKLADLYHQQMRLFPSLVANALMGIQGHAVWQVRPLADLIGQYAGFDLSMLALDDEEALALELEHRLARRRKPLKSLSGSEADAAPPRPRRSRGSFPRRSWGPGTYIQEEPAVHVDTTGLYDRNVSLAQRYALVLTRGQSTVPVETALYSIEHSRKSLGALSRANQRD